jgi:hypothetical protein
VALAVTEYRLGALALHGMPSYPEQLITDGGRFKPAFAKRDKKVILI